MHFVDHPGHLKYYGHTYNIMLYLWNIDTPEIIKILLLFRRMFVLASHIHKCTTRNTKISIKFNQHEMFNTA